MLNRYAVFHTEDYEARGGWHDLCETYPDLTEAMRAAEKAVGTGINSDAHIVDLIEGTFYGLWRTQEEDQRGRWRERLKGWEVRGSDTLVSPKDDTNPVRMPLVTP